MIQELLHENQRKLLGAAIAVLLLTAALLGFLAVRRGLTEKNGQAIREALSGLSYTEETAAAELEGLCPLEELRPASKQSRGELYRALAEISYMTGDEMLYNRYIASALYYLRESGDHIAIAYLTNKYVGRLYANGCYASAEELLLELAAKMDVSTLPLELQASYYLSRADVAHMQGRDEDELLAQARAAIRLMPDGGERRLNQAKADILEARCLLENGAFGEARTLMAAYSETDDFGLGRDQVYVVCDFKVPYYEIGAKLALEAGDEDAAAYCVERYMHYCEEYSFRAMELRLLRYMAADAEDGSAAEAGDYPALENRVARQNLRDMADKYGQFLLADLDAQTAAVAALEAKSALSRRHVLLTALVAYAIAALFCLGHLLFSYMSKDGLTRLSSRRLYEKMRIHCERGHVPYCLIMLDIDDFKQINDHFGHERGDEALRAISGVLRGYSGRGIFSYRYGGEELCMVLLRVPEPRSREIAEEIRRAVEATAGGGDMHITVSLGVACSKEGENVFRQADMKLYEAKESGKNRVC